MCSKLTQYQATAAYREAAEVTVRDSEGSEIRALWLGHVRDDNLKLSELRAVEVPGVEAMEHHGRGYKFSAPVSLRGFLREMSIRGQARQGLFLLTESIQTEQGPDRWPVLSTPSHLGWPEVISKAWSIEGSK